MNSDQAMPIELGSRLGHYDVTALIGEGGMGQVYQATDTKLNRQVALKILPEAFAKDPDRLARFQREAQVLASLNHPNIAQIHGLEESEGTRALVLELVEGPTLADRIAKGAIAIDEALPIAKQIAEALEAAHEAGVIHRDLKPANIKVRDDGTVKVLDFGLAKALDTAPEGDATESPTVTAMTVAGVILGTAAYMSPEQARGEPVDRRADIWSFGCVLFEMLTGTRVFDGKTPTEAIAGVLERAPVFDALPATAPPLVCRLLRRCLKKEPRRRLRDIADALADLEDASEVPAAAEVAVHSVSARPPYLRFALFAVAVLGSLGLVVVGLELWPPPTASGARHFVLLPPEGTEFGGGLLARTVSLAVSPDGQRLAFSAGSPRSLWIRSFDSLDAVPVSGTDGVSAFSPPAWSPDGRFIAFFQAGQLKTVSVTGGTPVTLADAPIGYGVTWSQDGTIVFSPGPQSGLFRISAAGGIPAPVTQLGPDDYGHIFPQFLPDGRHFLYLVRAALPRKGVYVGSIDSPDERFLRPVRERALYAPPGYLLFPDEGALMAQPFDADRLELGGDPLPVTASVAYVSNGRASYDVSPTGTLAYRVSGIHAGSQPILVNRSGMTLAAVGDPGDYQTAALSPDGSRLAIELHDLATGTGDLWVVELARNSTRKFTFDGAHNGRAVWSPDGTHLVFQGRPDGERNLHLKPLDGQSDEALLAPGPDRAPTDWSPDGRYVMYEEGPLGQRDLWTLEMPERAPASFLASEADLTDGRFSPDGRFVAFVSDETGRREVYVRSFPDALGVEKVSINGGAAPRWNPDGGELFFVDADRAILVVPVKTGESFEFGDPEPLFTIDMRANYRGWFATDGEQFLIVPNVVRPREAAPPITVAEDWTSLLRRGAP